MKHKFLEDLGIDINDDTKIQQFDLNGLWIKLVIID